MPGMTADLSFQIEERKDCQRLPNAALRYFPEVELVREQDKYLITGITEDELDQPDQESAAEKTSAAEKRTQRYVWVWEEPTLRAIPVTIGIRDSKWTELVSGDVKVGDRLVTAKK
jgi:HlyD family secretion protein